MNVMKILVIAILLFNAFTNITYAIDKKGFDKEQINSVLISDYATDLSPINSKLQSPPSQEAYDFLCLTITSASSENQIEIIFEQFHLQYGNTIEDFFSNYVYEARCSSYGNKYFLDSIIYTAPQYFTYIISHRSLDRIMLREYLLTKRKYDSINERTFVEQAKTYKDKMRKIGDSFYIFYRASIKVVMDIIKKGDTATNSV